MRLGSGVQTREGIVKAATTLFAQQGFEATTVQEVVEKAGATKGAFYHYFKSKEELLAAIHTRVLERELATLQAVIDEDTSPSEHLGRIVEHLAANYDDYREEMAVFNRERQYLAQPEFESLGAQRAQFEWMIDGVIRRGVKNGEFKPLPSIRPATSAIVGMAAWLYQWYEPSGKMSARDIGRMYADMLLDGMRTTPGTGPHSG
jgi:TetR/AcrR family transcriptional regulator, cholesterol catabolism regulator